MKINEIVTRAEDIDHLLKRAEKVVTLLEPLSKHPLVFREFAHKLKLETVLAKVVNDRGEYIARKGSNDKQPELLKALKISKPVFCTMETPWGVGLFGQPTIFVPPEEYRIVWSPIVEDMGGNRIAGDNHEKYGHTKIDQYTWRNPTPDRMVGPEFANTYQEGWPNGRIKNELIFDCEYYYLLDISVFLKKFAGLKNRELLKTDAFGDKLNRELFNTKFKNYGDVIWYLKNTLPSYLNWFKTKYPNAK